MSGVGGGRRLRRSDRLRSARDFRRLSRDGRRIVCRSCIVLAGCRPRAIEGADLGGPRLGITVSRRIGNAVARNRVKRAIREWFRHHRQEIPKGKDVVVIARGGARMALGSQIHSDLDEVLRGLSRASRR